MQRGTIIRHRASWTLLYWDWQYRDGKKKRVRVSRKLSPVSREFPTRSSVRQLADDILAPLNRRQLQPESSLLVTEFIETVYFPAVESELRPSTIYSYKNAIYFPHLKKRLEKPPLRLRDFRPVHAQRILRDIPDVGHTTLLHIKNFLSGVFRFARREGVLDTPNPLADVTVPGRPIKFHGKAYSIDDVDIMLENFPEGGDGTPVAIILLLSLTGLRQSEIRALRWEDWDEKQQVLHIRRSIWGTRLGPTKTISSQNFVPLLKEATDVLEQRRAWLSPQPTDYIFAGKKGRPLNLHNLENRVIKPALKHLNGLWAGFHGFRRGLATNLLEANINPATIARILRHESAAVTLAYYAKAREHEPRAALEKLAEHIKNRPTGLIIDGKEATHG